MADATKLEVEVVTPEKAVFTGTADELVLPGSIGEMGVLPGHVPLLTGIAMGDLAVIESGKVRHFFIEGGYAEILPNKVTVLTENCDGVDDIDIARAREAVEEAEKELLAHEQKSKGEEAEGDIRAAHEQALERARKRLLVAEENK